MTAEEAQRQLLFDTSEEQGAFLQLRLGNDPGTESMTRLRFVLRVLWNHYKSQGALPYDISFAAGMILRFQDEASRNVRASGRSVRDRLLSFELPDVVLGAFDLLAGPIAQEWTVRRKDLGE
jgi:hypothetical protein